MVPVAQYSRRFRNVKTRTSSLHIVLGLASLVVIAAFFMMSHHNQGSSAADSQPAAKYSTNDRTSRIPSIKYMIVDSSSEGVQKEDFVRYAAYELTSETQRAEQRTPVSVQRWAELFSVDTEWASSLRDDLSDIIRSSPYKALFFETKGASLSSANKQFEFVLIDAPYLYSFADGNPDSATFAQHLKCSPKELPGCAFKSLGRDATLVAPRREPNTPESAYAHLAAFVRGASADQVNRYWKMVATEYLKALQNRTVWLSTDGTGVAWLHMRLDSRPKYYSYREFANET